MLLSPYVLLVSNQLAQASLDARQGLIQKIKNNLNRNCLALVVLNIGRNRRPLIKQIQQVIDKRGSLPKALICLGGDGTINSILSFALENQIPCYPIPMGTANDLCSHFDKNSILDFDWKKLQEKEIDTLEVNSKPFLTVGGIGPIAEAGIWANYLKGQKLYKKYPILGKSIYTATFALSTIRHFNSLFRQSFALRDEKNGIYAMFEASMIIVANTKCVGKKFVLYPDAKIDDEIFQVICFTHKNLADLFKTVCMIYLGKDVSKDPNLIFFKTSQFVIESTSPVDFLADGEVLANQQKKFSIQVAAQKWKCLL